MKKFFCIYFAFMCGIVAVAAQSNEIWETKQGNGGLVITKYKGNEQAVVIPASINGTAVAGLDGPVFDNKVTSVSIPPGVVSIGSYCFNNSASLRYLAVDKANPVYQTIDNVLFDKTGKTLIRYPAGKDETSYTIPSGVTEIGVAAFSKCNNMRSIIIPEGVMKIGESSFVDCASLSSISLPSTVVSIPAAFLNLSKNIRYITVANANPAYQAIDDVLFDKSGKSLFFYPCGKPDPSYAIPAGITTIAAWSFTNNRGSLRSVIIPEGVTAIEGNAFVSTDLVNISIPSSVTVISPDAFNSSNNLRYITIDSNNKVYQSIDNVLFDKSKGILIRYLPIKKESSYTIPPGVTAIGPYAFSPNNTLTTVIIPEGVLSIGYNAFVSSVITSLNIPKSVTFMDFGIFQHCSKLKSISLPEGITSIGSSMFAGCKELANITIPNSVITIANRAFSGCTGITSIAFPETVGKINSEAFMGCTSLTRITIGEFVTLGNNALPNGFADFYGGNREKAGTYTWDGNKWSYLAR
jgi:hypothetical protein